MSDFAYFVYFMGMIFPCSWGMRSVDATLHSDITFLVGSDFCMQITMELTEKSRRVSVCCQVALGFQPLPCLF